MSQVITLDIKEDEALILTLYRHITSKRLRDGLLHMAEDLLQLKESRQGYLQRPPIYEDSTFELYA